MSQKPFEESKLDLSDMEALSKALSPSHTGPPLKVQALFGPDSILGDPKMTCGHCKSDKSVMFTHVKEVKKTLCNECCDAYYAKDEGKAFAAREIKKSS